MENSNKISGYVKIEVMGKVVWENYNTLSDEASIIFASAMAFHPGLDLSLNQILVNYTLNGTSYTYQSGIESAGSNGINVARFKTSIDPLEFEGDITSLVIKPSTTDDHFASISIEPTFPKSLNQGIKITWQFELT
jgi:hypothetical protein